MGLGSTLYKSSPHILRTAMLNLYACSLNFERYGKKFERVLEEFERNEKFSRGEMAEYQREKLIALIRHAHKHVPYYRDVMHELKLVPDDFKDLKDIAKLPILTRDEVKLHNRRLQADNVPKYKIRHGHTSGTTGSPLGFLWDINVCVAHHAADWRQKKWAGLEFGDPFISLQGRQVVPADRKKPPFWVMNYMHNQLFMSSFHLKDEYLGSYVKKIQQFKPMGVEGYPSSIYILARYLSKIKAYCPVPAVLTSSETLLPMQRELIEERFQCEVFDFFGMAERVLYASECRCHAGKHLNSDYGIVEIIDKDSNVLPEGEFGTIVATGLWNFAMPLIRYETSDASSILPGQCACGRSFPLMNQVMTKFEDIIVLADGRMIPSSVLTHPFKPLSSILKSQIVQIDFNTIEVNIVKGSEYTENDTSILMKGMKERLGDNVTISIRFVQDIPNDKSGKFRWVISKVRMS